MIEISRLMVEIAGRRILSDIDLTIPKGGITALIGPNGAGKSTLLSAMCRINPIADGQIKVDDLSIEDTPSRDLARKITLMAQDNSVVARLRVRELVAFGRFPHHKGKAYPADQAETERVLSLFELDRIADRFVDTLSGGERQRARAAMSFCQGTDYLLMDEPLSNLDIYYARELMGLIKGVAEAEERTIVIVLHDINQAAAYADRIVAMKEGRIIASGQVDEVLTTPVLEKIFGYSIPVAMVEGRRVCLHFA
ncbi:MAG: ATP-binding cassette domain-containing protein [Pseudomonadota bacterium]